MFLSFSQQKQKKGQGLLIYIIILAFIALVGFAVMHLLGSRIGSPHTTSVSNSGQSADGIVTGSFEADDLYWNNPSNGCTQGYTYGTNAGCDAIIDRVDACLAGGSGSYCDDYFAVFPR